MTVRSVVPNASTEQTAATSEDAGPMNDKRTCWVCGSAGEIVERIGGARCVASGPCEERQRERLSLDAPPVASESARNASLDFKAMHAEGERYREAMQVRIDRLDAPPGVDGNTFRVHDETPDALTEAYDRGYLAAIESGDCCGRTDEPALDAPPLSFVVDGAAVEREARLRADVTASLFPNLKPVTPDGPAKITSEIMAELSSAPETADRPSGAAEQIHADTRALASDPARWAKLGERGAREASPIIHVNTMDADDPDAGPSLEDLEATGPSTAPICSACNDTHRMKSRPEWACTSCPSPCQKCRQGGTGAFCEKTPCACACHANQHQYAHRDIKPENVPKSGPPRKTALGRQRLTSVELLAWAATRPGGFTTKEAAEAFPEKHLDHHSPNVMSTILLKRGVLRREQVPGSRAYRYFLVAAPSESKSPGEP